MWYFTALFINYRKSISQNLKNHILKKELLLVFITN